MPTVYMKLPYEEKVLRPGCLKELKLPGGVVGFTLEVGLNYYRGLPLSAVEKFELTIDGEKVPSELMLFELDDKIFTPEQLPLAISEFWSIKKNLVVRVFNGGLSAGKHTVELAMDVRNVSMYFGAGGWGMIDGSATRELELQEAK